MERIEEEVASYASSERSGSGVVENDFDRMVHGQAEEGTVALPIPITSSSDPHGVYGGSSEAQQVWDRVAPMAKSHVGEDKSEERRMPSGPVREFAPTQATKAQQAVLKARYLALLQQAHKLNPETVPLMSYKDDFEDIHALYVQHTTTQESDENTESVKWMVWALCFGMCLVNKFTGLMKLKHFMRRVERKLAKRKNQALFYRLGIQYGRRLKMGDTWKLGLLVFGSMFATHVRNGGGEDLLKIVAKLFGKEAGESLVRRTESVELGLSSDSETDDSEDEGKPALNSKAERAKRKAKKAKKKSDSDNIDFGRGLKFLGGLMGKDKMDGLGDMLGDSGLGSMLGSLLGGGGGGKRKRRRKRRRPASRNKEQSADTTSGGGPKIEEMATDDDDEPIDDADKPDPKAAEIDESELFSDLD